MDILTIGIIGYGYWGKIIVKSLLKHAHIRLVVFDIDPTTQKHVPQEIVIAPSFASLISYPGLIGAIIATPPHTHYAIAKDLLQHNIHTFVEKPMTMSAKEAQYLMRSAKKRARILMVDHTYRYAKQTQTIASLLAENYIGKIHAVHMERANNMAPVPNTDVLWDLLPHDVSLLLTWFGMPISISGALPTPYSGYSFFHYPTFSAEVITRWMAPKKIRIVEIIGEKGILVWDDTKHNILTNVSLPGKHPSPSTYTVLQDTYQDIPPLTLALSDFINAITNTRAPQISAHEGVLTVKIIEKIHSSHHSCQKMPV